MVIWEKPTPQPAPVCSDPEFAAGIAELKKCWPALAEAAAHPLTEILARWDRKTSRVVLLAGYVAVAATGLILWLYQMGFERDDDGYDVFARLKTRKVLNIFFVPGEQLALLPITFHQYIAMRLTIQFFRQRRIKQIFLWLIVGTGLAGGSVFILMLAGRQLPFDPIIFLRNALFIVWTIMHFVILPSHNQLLSLDLTRIFSRFVKGEKPVYVTSRFMIVAIFIVFSFLCFTLFARIPIFGVFVYIAASIIYHLVARISFQTISLDQYFDSLKTFKWEFEADERGAVKIFCYRRTRW